MKVTAREHCPGGYMVTLEIPGAYTDGSSRFEKVFVPFEAVRGKTPAQKRQALFDAIADELGGFVGAEVSEPPATKEILEDRMTAKYEEWQRWKTTRVEAQARSLPGNQVNALANKEDAVWAAYVALIQAWRAA